MRRRRRASSLALLALTALLALPASAPLAAQQRAPGGASTADLPPERPDPVLQREVERLVRGFGGGVGVYVRHLPTGRTAAVNADSVFPTASLVKVPILVAMYDAIERGELALESVQRRPAWLEYRYVEGTDVTSYMATGDSLPLRELAFLMLTVSDNVASLWIQALVGGGLAVNEWLGAHGYERTRVNSRTPGREQARATYGWGQTSPREMARLFTEIRTGAVVSPAAAEDMYRLLTKTYWDREAVSQIPPHVQAASKQGFVDRARSEVLLVNAPSGDYVLAVMTKDQTDTSHARDNEGHRLIRAVSRLAWERFEPDEPWRPARP
jgi:beta-lactamase class A